MCLTYLLLFDGKGNYIIIEIESPNLLSFCLLIDDDFLKSLSEFEDLILGECDGEEISFVLPPWGKL
jgi:hypothetical protein